MWEKRYYQKGKNKQLIWQLIKFVKIPYWCWFATRSFWIWRMQYQFGCCEEHSDDRSILRSRFFFTPWSIDKSGQVIDIPALR